LSFRCIHYTLLSFCFPSILHSTYSTTIRWWCFWSIDIYSINKKKYFIDLFFFLLHFLFFFHRSWHWLYWTSSYTMSICYSTFNSCFSSKKKIHWISLSNSSQKQRETSKQSNQWV
jgi:hypothetical protein